MKMLRSEGTHSSELLFILMVVFKASGSDKMGLAVQC